MKHAEMIELDKTIYILRALQQTQDHRLDVQHHLPKFFSES